MDNNSESYENHDLYQRAKKVSSSDPEALGAFYNELKNDYKNSSSIKCRRLGVLRGNEFKSALVEYLIPYFQKGLPSLFSEIKYLYNDSEKRVIIEEVLLSIEKSLSQSNTLLDTNEATNPCCLLWANMLLAQHFNKTERYETALIHIDKVMDKYRKIIKNKK